MLAFSYVRFSSKEQAKGSSLQRQLAATQAYCDRVGITLDDSLRLHDLGVSAFKGNNARVGALGSFLRLVEAGRIPSGSVLIVENIDRLSRDQVGEALQLFIGILSRKIKIVTLTPEREYTQASINDIGNLLIPLIDFSRAYEESARKSVLIGAAWKGKRKKARDTGAPMTSCCPYWLCLSDDKTRFDPIPERVAVVERIYGMAEECMAFGFSGRGLDGTHAAADLLPMRSRRT